MSHTQTTHHLWLMSLLLLLSISLNAQCLEGNCQTGEGTFLFDNGQRFVGNFNKGEPSGEGILFYPNGERYMGHFVNGLAHGQGRYLYTNGSSRKGVWFEGVLRSAKDQLAPFSDKGKTQYGCVSGNCQNGTGTYTNIDGSVYIGEFKQGEIHGQGICTYTDGSRYEGQWAHRYPQGQGTKTWADGRQFTGQWERGQPISNKGIFNSINRPFRDMQGTLIIQSGCIKGDCLNGRGTYAYADGSRYEGSFLSGQPHGQGVFYYPNGDKYIGQFSYGLPHGKGRRQYASGRQLEGQWFEGGFVRPPSSQINKGCKSGDCKNGFGTYVFKKGDHYEGSFRNGVPHGHGIVNYANGDRYEGGMINGSFGGYGTFYEKDGGVFEGLWENGTYMGNRTSAKSESIVRLEPQMKTWALIIGVSSYTHMPALRFPDDDAYRLFAFLKSPQGGAIPDERIRILIDEDATKSGIIKAMNDLFLRAGSNDLVVLYFSGHGLPGSFLPIDYDGVNNTLTHTEIKRMLDRSPAGYKLCLADACHSGGLLAARGEGLPNLLTRYYENLASSRKGTALIMSSKAEETSLESSGLRQGVFSHFLLRGMKGEADVDMDGVVRVQELFQYVAKQVKAYTGNQQSPVIQGDYDKRMPVAVLKR